MSYFYTTFGLSLESAIACPELLPSNSVESPDIVICYGKTPESLDAPADSNPYWQAAPGNYLLKLENIGNFHVKDGNEIIVQPRGTESEEEIRGMVLGTCLSLLLHQSKLFALHVSGVQTSQGAALTAGQSGAGKSTLVNAFLQREYKLPSDDMLALTIKARGQVVVLPGFSQVKIWSDSARELGHATDKMRLISQKADNCSFSGGSLRPNTGIPARHVHPRSPSPARIQDRIAAPRPVFQRTDQPHLAKKNLSGLGLRKWQVITPPRSPHRLTARASPAQSHHFACKKWWHCSKLKQKR